MSSKYDALASFLRSQGTHQITVTLSYKDIEKIIGAKLPQSAFKHRPWWGNQVDCENRPQAKAWLSAGFRVETVTEGGVRFARNR